IPAFEQLTGLLQLYSKIQALCIALPPAVGRNLRTVFRYRNIRNTKPHRKVFRIGKIKFDSVTGRIVPKIRRLTRSGSLQITWILIAVEPNLKPVHIQTARLQILDNTSQLENRAVER